MKVNFNNVTELSYIQEAGTYTVKVIDVKRETAKSGNEMDVFTLQTQDGQSMKLRLVLNDKSFFKYKAFIRAIRGLKDTDQVGEVDIDEFSRAAVGKKLKIEVVRQKPELNIVTGVTEESQFFEIKRLFPIV